MADGSITFSTALDNSELDKQIKDAESQIERLKKTIEQKTSKRNAVKEQIEEANEAIKETEADIERLKARLAELQASGESPTSGRTQVVVEELDKASQSLVKQVDAAAELDKQYYKLDDEVTKYSNKLSEAQAGYQQLSSAAQASMTEADSATGRAAAGIKNKLGAAAQGARVSMTNAANSVGNAWTMVASKITKTMRKVFVFSLIVGAIRAIKEQLSSMIASNEQFHASIENLKVVASGFIAAFANVVLPAFMGIVNVLAGVLERVAGLIDFIFGSNISGMIAQARSSASANIQASNAEAVAQSAGKAASATDKQAKSTKKLAKEQKKANRELLGFDELNVLTAEDAEDAADAIDNLADTDSIGDSPVLTPDWTQGFVPDAGFFQPILDWLDEIRRRIETDVEGPFAKIREGLNLIKQGFQELIQGIMTGDWALAWRGFGDIVIGILYVLQGAIWAFLNWLDEVTGGHFHDFFQGIALMLQGVVDIIEGLLRGNLSLTIQGIFELIEGLAQTLGGAVDGVLWLVNSAWSQIYQFLSDGIDGIFDYLADKYPEYAEFFESLRNVAHMALDFIDRTFRGLLEAAGRTLHNWIDGAKQVIEGFVNIIVGIFTLNGELIAQGVQQIIDGVYKYFEGSIGKLAELLSNWLTSAKELCEDAIGSVCDALTSAGDIIDQGISGIVNGILGAVEGALNGVIYGAVDMINDLIDGANMIPGVWIPYVYAPTISIPRLAGGAVIPPNREFMAVLGDQTSGNNLEAPESLIRQIVREETQNDQTNLLLMQILTAIQAGKTLECDGYTLAKVVNQRNMINGNLYGRL